MKKIYIFILICIVFQACSNIPEFNKERAFNYLLDQCDLGPRYPGSAEIELCREYIINNLESTSSEIELQEFSVTIQDEEYQGVNIIAHLHPRMSRRILLGAHYDTRPWADKEQADSLKTIPIIGANDAASGVAVLLEIARITSENPPPEYGIDFVFFDLEDMGEYGNNKSWCRGSTYFAQNYNDNLPEKAVIVDMIGDNDLQLPMEYFSYHNSPNLVNEIWDIGQNLGFLEFKTRIGPRIFDDHMPLIQSGFNAVDIIDFDYPYWHTLQDTPDKCSPRSLYVVGQTLLQFIYNSK